MATTSSTPTKPPLLNERDRRGTKVRTLNADLTTIARFIPQRPGCCYIVNIDVIGVRLLTAGATLPAGYGVSRRAVFITDANTVVSQIGSTDTIGTDRVTDSSNFSVSLSTDGTNVNVNISAEYPADWSVYGVIEEVDQYQVG